jgi:hypothetical protein
MPYILVPFAYLLSLKFLGEHSVVTEMSGFVILALSSLVAKLSITGVVDPTLFVGTAVFFTAAVFKVRVQFKKGFVQRVIMVIYIGFAIAVYRTLSIPVIVLLPLSDNLLFSISLYRAKLSFTGWLEVLKGVVFLFLMALNYR